LVDLGNPELVEFAATFNEILGRLQTHPDELKAANDQLAQSAEDVI